MPWQEEACKKYKSTPTFQTQSSLEEYAEKYAAMLTELESARKLRQKHLCAFWPMRGAHYSPGKGLMVIGRAVNGWEPEWKLIHARSDGNEATTIAHKAREFSEQCRTMDWVVDSAKHPEHHSGYNTNRSAFWRVTKRILCSLLSRNEENWSTWLSWSNLAKVSPAKKGNPGTSLLKAQREPCAELLKLELEELQPAHVLVVAGKDWWKPFIQHFPIDPVCPCQTHSYIEAIFREPHRCWVFTVRPESRPEKPFTKEVLAAFRGG